MKNGRTFVIAEAGVNHNGSLALAKSLVEVAADAGVDAVKFQTFRADTLVSPDAPKAEYQQRNDGAGESQYAMLKRLELSASDHDEIIAYCRRCGIEFLSTPFDVTDIDYLKNLDMRLMKVPSGAITDYPYLKKINECGLPVILSTGMSTIEEVAEALAVLKDCRVSLLHCTTEYPCPFDAVNLKAMLTLREKFGLPVGYSDHTKGIEVPIAAVAIGAEIIEKHFTIDRNLPGPDHKASIEPKELKNMVSAIRHIEQSLGDGIKVPSPVEMKNIPIARKSIVAERAIRKGEFFTAANITVKRPGSGISPMRWPEVIGTQAKRDYQKGDML